MSTLCQVFLGSFLPKNTNFATKIKFQKNYEESIFYFGVNSE